VARIGAQIGVAIDPADVLKPFHGNRCIGQFSKGAALRFREMAPEQQSVFLERYATLYRQYTFETAAAAEAADRQRKKAPQARGQLAQHLINLNRRFRSYQATL